MRNQIDPDWDGSATEQTSIHRVLLIEEFPRKLREESLKSCRKNSAGRNIVY